MAEEYNALIANDTWTGQSQQQGLDYDETFSPVVKPTTIQTVLTLTASKNWVVHQLDVKNAFLHVEQSSSWSETSSSSLVSALCYFPSPVWIYQ
ncbi:hypothetical protein LIER_08547 [Lithospermum erythrorhizon]|uniref:Reverse transcriptase Ty1/copia-type domain-containing protein n=1 Tax=Lithospermum erythrorhizon TaxID=34254 RepID=A0AAV3PDP2_LITER